MALPVAPPEVNAPSMGVDPSAPPTEPIPLQATGDVQNPGPNPSLVHAEATQNVDIPTLRKLAASNPNTPIAEAANRNAEMLESGQKKLSALAVPVVNAETPGEKNIAAANAFKSVKDYPQWGTALMMWLGGDKKSAVNMVTGGQPITSVKYGLKSGKAYLYTTDQLGTPIGITDRNGNAVSNAEYEADGNGVDSVKDSLYAQNLNKIAESNTNSLNAGVKGFNGYSSAYNAVTPIIKQSDSWFSDLQKSDPQRASTINQKLNASGLIPILQGHYAGTLNKGSGTNASSGGLNQNLNGVNDSTGTSNNIGLNGTVGIGKGPNGVSIGPSAGISADNGKTTGLSNSGSVLNQGQSSKGGTTENSQGTQDNQQTFAKKLQLSGLDAETQARLIDMWKSGDVMNAQKAELEKNGLRMPSFITPVSSTNVADGLAGLRVLYQKQLMNSALLDGFNKFYQDNIGLHTKPGVPPSMEEMEAAYTKTGNTPDGQIPQAPALDSYKGIQSKFLKEVSDILHSVPKTAPENQFKDAEAALSQIPKAVAPPTKKSGKPANEFVFDAKRFGGR